MDRRRRRKTVAVLVALMAVLAGCGGAAQGGSTGGGDGGSGASSAELERGAETVQPEAADVAAESTSDDASATQSLDSRALVRTGQIRLEVTDFERTERNLTRLVESREGFVSDTQQRQRRVGERTYLVGRVVLRVPNERFSETFADVQREGTVIESSTSTEDVTEQLVDIEARLNNLRVQRDRLRTLYENANDTEAILRVERRLSEVQTEIERLEARKQALERRVAFSTITVEIREERPDRLGVDEKWYEIGFVSAFLQSVDGVIVVGRAAVVLVGYALPYLLAVGVPIGVLGGVVAWRRGWNLGGGRVVDDTQPESPLVTERDSEPADGTDESEPPGGEREDADDRT